MKKKEFVSVIVPCRKEYQYVKDFLITLVNQDYSKKNLEIIIIDGNSSDGTQEIIREFTKKYRHIELLVNEEALVPKSLNMGLKRAEGTIVIRMDVHSLYPDNYVSKLLYWMNHLKADNVGGTIDTISSTHSLGGRAIAVACSSRVGVGNTYFRRGSDRAR